MITYSNVIRHENIPFEKYLKLGGFSHSFLKGQKNGISPYFNVTDKVRMGSLVDALLTQDDRFDFSDPLAKDAMRIASQIKDTFGGMIANFKNQISYTATAQYGAFSLDVTGRLDWELPRFAVIDLKVTGAKNDREFSAYIDHMGYKNQLWHYAKMAGLTKAYIMPYSTTSKRCLNIVPIEVGDYNSFWEDAVLTFGKVINISQS